jgi:hypothetical protein
MGAPTTIGRSDPVYSSCGMHTSPFIHTDHASRVSDQWKPGQVQSKSNSSKPATLKKVMQLRWTRTVTITAANITEPNNADATRVLLRFNLAIALSALAKATGGSEILTEAQAESLRVSRLRFLSWVAVHSGSVDNDLGNHDAAGEVEGLRLGLDVNASERREIPKDQKWHK